jgi:hypothetical protein
MGLCNTYTEKKVENDKSSIRVIILTSVYGPDIPFEKPFFLLETRKRLSAVAECYNLVPVSLFINSLHIDERNQPLKRGFNITYNKCFNKS